MATRWRSTNSNGNDGILSSPLVAWSTLAIFALGVLWAYAQFSAEQAVIVRQLDIFAKDISALSSRVNDASVNAQEIRTRGDAMLVRLAALEREAEESRGQENRLQQQIQASQASLLNSINTASRERHDDINAASKALADEVAELRIQVFALTKDGWK